MHTRPMQWNTEPRGRLEARLVDCVPIELEMYERDVLRVRTEFREFHNDVVFRSIVTDLVCNVHRLPPLGARFLVSIDWHSCPYGIDHDASFRPGTEDPRYVVSALQELGYLEVQGSATNGTTVLICGGQKLYELRRPPSPNSGVIIEIPEDLPQVTHQQLHEAANDEGASSSSAAGLNDWEPSLENPLDHSIPLDVHTWSNHPESNALVNSIYETHFRDGNEKIQKRHLKVVLLHLYVTWCTDPKLKVSYQRNVNAYKPKSRYNSLHISKKTIQVVNTLISAGLVEHKLGFNDQETGISRESRMWPTEALIEKFRSAKFGPLDVGNHENKECIILREQDSDTGKQIKIEYENDEQIKRMRRELRDYYALLCRTFIDIPTLKENSIDLGLDKKGRPKHLIVSQRDKFVRRIFNRGSFKKGGRFWGGWWQRCPKEWRERIFINDEPTVEIDYSGLHIVLLYAKAGIDYWKVVGVDPYTIPKPDFLMDNEQTRRVCKGLVLVALNAKDEESAYRAFRSEAAAGSAEKRLTNEQLAFLLATLKAKHKPIANEFASDAGIDLMNLDAKITEDIIRGFTATNQPILTIHDSYIVIDGHEEVLGIAMREAFARVAEIRGVALKQAVESNKDMIARHYARAASDLRNPGRHALLVSDYDMRNVPYKTERYKFQLEQFRRWLEAQPITPTQAQSFASLAYSDQT